MIAAAEAHRRVLDAVLPGPTETLGLGDAAGRILRAAVRADRPAPPHDRVMMDGYALAFRAWEAGRRKFRRAGTVAAGEMPAALPEAGAVLEVMTGAVLPEGCDTVVPVEARVGEDAEEILLEDPFGQPLRRGNAVHARGSGGAAGRTVLAPGDRLGPGELGVAATEGAVRLEVNAVPRVLLLTTGDEVVDPAETPLPHQIRGSHALALEGLFRAQGEVRWRHRHLPDCEEVLRGALADAFAEVDFLFLAGGVSKGQRDYLPDLLGELGVERIFHRVAQRPGHPLWFGRHGAVPVFGFPGNPLSALCCARRHAVPALDRWRGAGEPAVPRLRPTEPLAARPGSTGFHPVRVEAGGRACPTAPLNSGDLHALAGTDGFLECPPAEEIEEEGPEGGEGSAAGLDAAGFLPFYAWRA
jgi:molybdopterin molybdotransferase